MPCRYDPSPAEIEASRVAANQRQKAKETKLLKDLDKLTHDNDVLRETLLNMINDPDYEIPDDVVKLIEKDQIEHRKVDLARLKKVFTKARDAERLGLVVLANPTKPLYDQLGFDADEF